MKAIMEGYVTQSQPDFHLTNLWFSNDNAESTDTPSIDCIGLSCDGFDCVTSVKTTVNKTEFLSRWDEVYLTDVDEYGSAYQTRLFSIKQLMLMIEKGDMTLRNIEAFIDGNAKVYITKIQLFDDEGSYVVDKLMHSEPIEFIESSK